MEELIDGSERLMLKVNHHTLTVEEKSALVKKLLEGSKNGRLQHGALKDASEKWNVNVHTVYRVWKRYGNQRGDSAMRGITFKETLVTAVGKGHRTSTSRTCTSE
uniref:AlNc14C45G3682 protein n=1 Tax=Albugo laibachii Nc14 TaxID=890382 RepID=F0WAF5_9STRA|nr:AlNc14C45G3682 [Albugo laibachii Nc14]|eukprot:CCA18126.1 AlNc14C45G3682 [Albugo laibachii Nc14]